MAKDNARFQRVDVPPPMGRVLHVFRVDATLRTTLLVLSPGIWGTYTHWNGRRTVQCRGSVINCEECSHERARRWCGFLHVCDLEMRSEGFLELTQLAGHRVKALLEEHNSLRGLKIHVYRERKTMKAPLQIEYSGKYDGPRQMPTARTPEETLSRLWGLRSAG